METLTNKLQEAHEDILALRKQLKHYITWDENNQMTKVQTGSFCNKDYEQLVQDLEKVQNKVMIIYCLGNLIFHIPEALMP